MRQGNFFKAIDVSTQMLKLILFCFSVLEWSSYHYFFFKKAQVSRRVVTKANSEDSGIKENKIHTNKIFRFYLIIIRDENKTNLQSTFENTYENVTHL